MWRSTAALPRMRLVDAKVSTVLCFIGKLSLKSTMWWSVIHLSYILDSAVGLFKQPSLMQHVSTFDNEKLGLFRNWTVAEALQCMHAGRRCWEKAVYRHRSGERRLWGQRGQFSPSPGAASEPREFSVLNPSRSLIPRPGEGRGEGREGGSSRPQRTPTNLERGQTKLSILYWDAMNEWMN